MRTGLACHPPRAAPPHLRAQNMHNPSFTSNGEARARGLSRSTPPPRAGRRGAGSEPGSSQPRKRTPVRLRRRCLRGEVGQVRGRVWAGVHFSTHTWTWTSGGRGGQGARHEPLCAGAFGTPRQRGGQETAQGRNRRWGASTTWPYAGRPGPLLAAGAHVAVRRRAAPRLLARVSSVARALRSSSLLRTSSSAAPPARTGAKTWRSPRGPSARARWERRRRSLAPPRRCWRARAPPSAAVWTPPLACASRTAAAAAGRRLMMAHDDVTAARLCVSHGSSGSRSAPV